MRPPKKPRKNGAGNNRIDYLLSSGLYRRHRNFTESAKRLAGYTAGQEFHPALKINISHIIISRKQDFVNSKICDHQCTENDPVQAKDLEIVFFYVIHQEFDNKYRNNECCYHSCCKDSKL